MAAATGNSIAAESQLKKLDSESQDLLRSGIAITSVAQCVEELVLNSLDAGSTCVAVRIDLPCGRIQCVDNGCGMSREQLEKVARRYSTSKCKGLDDITHNLGHYGYRGEALASVRSIAAILEIQTRSSTKTYVREFVDGYPKTVAEGQMQRPSSGTTITIHDLFNKLPVRKKNLNVNLELELIRQRMEGIALIHPWIAFSLRNDDSNQLILKTSKSNSVAGTFAQLFTTSKSRGLCDISNSFDDFEVKGYISKEGHHNKNLQYVYVNGRLVLKSKVHRVINWMISRSNIARKRHEVIGDNGSPTRITTERYGVYVINVTCPLSQYDITFDPRKTLVEFKSWGSLLRCLEKAVKDFLICEGLKGEKSEMSDSPEFQKYLDDGETAEEVKEVVSEGNTNEDNYDNNKYGANISTWQSVSNKHSISVCRPRHFTSIQDLVKDSETGGKITDGDDDVDSALSNLSQFAAANALPSDELISQSEENELSGRDSNNLSDVANTVPGVRDKTFLSLEEGSEQPSEQQSDLTRYTSVPQNGSISSVEHLSKARCGSVNSTKAIAKKVAEYKSPSLSNPCKQTYRSSLQKFKRHIGKPPSSAESVKTTRLPKDEILANFDLIKQKLKRKKMSHANATNKFESLPSRSNVSVNNEVPVTEPMPVFHIPINDDDVSSSMQQDNDPVPSTSEQSRTHHVCNESDTADIGSQTWEMLPESSFDLSLGSYPICGQLSNNISYAKKRRSTTKQSYASKLSKISGYEGKNSRGITNSSHEFLSTGSLIQTGQDLNLSNSKSTNVTRPNTSHRDIPEIGFDSYDDGPLQTWKFSFISDSQQFTGISDPNTQKKSSNESKSYGRFIYEALVDSDSGPRISTRIPGVEFDNILSNTSKLCDTSPKACDGKQIHCLSPTETLGISPDGNSVCVSVKSMDSEHSISKANTLPSDGTIFPDTKLKSYTHVPSSIEKQAPSSETNSKQLTAGNMTNFKPIFLENPFKKHRHSLAMEAEVVKQKIGQKLAEPVIEEGLNEKSEGSFTPRKIQVTKQADVVGQLGVLSTVSDFNKNVEKLDQCNQTGSCDKAKMHTVISNDDIPSKLTDDITYVKFKNSNDIAITAEQHRVHAIQDDSLDHSSDQSALDVPSFTGPLGCHLGTQGFNTFAEGYSQGFELGEPCTQEFSVSLNDDSNGLSVSIEDGFDLEKQTENRMTSSFENVNVVNNPCSTLKGRNKDIPETKKVAISTLTSQDGKPNNLTTRESRLDSQDNLGNGDGPDQCANDKAVINCSQNDLTNALKQKQNGFTTLMPVVDEISKNTGGWQKTQGDQPIASLAGDDAISDTNQKDEKENEHGDTLHNSGISVPCPEENTLLQQQDSLGGSVTKCSTGATDAEASVTTQEISNSSAVDDAKVKIPSTMMKSSGYDMQVTDAELLALDAVPSTSAIKSVAKKDNTTIFVGPSWICKMDPVSGEKVYVNRITGCSSLEKPSLLTCDVRGSSSTSTLSTSKTHKLLSGNASVFLQQVEQQKIQRQLEKDEDQKIYEMGEIKDLVDTHFGNLDLESVAIKWRQGSAPHEYERIDSRLDGPPVLSADSMQNRPTQFESRLQYAIHPQKITKSMLSSMKVIGQLDNKFIACVMQKDGQLGMSNDLNSWLLVVIDQHAAHERVRLEQLKDDAYEENDDTTLKSSELNPVLELTMLPEDVRLMSVYRKHLSSIGIAFDIEPRSQTCVKVTTLPKCFIDEKTSQLKQGRASVTPSVIQIMLKKRLELLQTTGGACATIPMDVHHLLCLEACHGAVKFGDALSLKECRLLVENLYECKLPFQCAHGRPSVMPLLDLEKLACMSESAKKSKPRLKSLKLKMDEENTSKH